MSIKQSIMIRVTFLPKIFFVILISFLSVQNANAISLHEALAIAYTNNPELKAKRNFLLSVNENLPQAYAGFLPTIRASYSTSRENERISTSSLTQNSPITEQISISQPVFNGGGTISDVKRAKNVIRSQQEALRQTEQIVLFNAVKAYINVVRTREVLKLSKNNEKVLEEQLEATKDRFTLGETTRTDVAQSKSRLARAQSDRINAHGNLIAAISEYKRIYDVDPPASMSMPEISNLPDVPDTFEEALSLSLKKNPTLKIAEFDEKAARNNIWIRKSRILPSINITGSVRREDKLSERRGSSIDSETVSLNVNIPIFQSGGEYSAVRQAKKSADEAAFNFQNTRNSVIDSATKSWQQIQTSIADIKATTSSVDAAKLALDGVKQEQEIGSRTTLDVLDAEQELFVAQVELITAKRNAVNAYYNMSAAMGKLNAKALSLDVDIYVPEVDYNKTKYKMFGF